MTALRRPEEAPYIHRFQQVMNQLPAFVELFAATEHDDHRCRVFIAWVQWRSDGAGQVAMTYGPHFFYERYLRALDDAQQGIESVVRDYAVDRIDQIEPIDEIGSCNDPDQLLRMLDGARLGSEYRASDVGRFEISRKLAIATQLMCIACADPHERVTNDLTRANLLAGQRLFTSEGDHIKMAIEFVLNPDSAHHLDVRYPIQLSPDVEARFAWPEGVQAMKRIFVCRTIRDGDRQFYVRTDSRPKSRISGVFKLERGAKLMDRRGMKFVVVAVKDGDVLRLATRDDAKRVTVIARERLWQSPLREEPDNSRANPHSSQDYWAEKIVGRLEGKNTAAGVELQVTSLADDLTARFATDEVGHKNYRGRVIRTVILDEWFPADVYGIDWSGESTFTSFMGR